MIGIAISTYSKRPQYLNSTLLKIEKFRPKNASIAIVFDDSQYTGVNPKIEYHFPQRVGIPRVKNKCIELLYNLGCEHFFLFDDDTYPIQKNWHEPYVNSPHDHLCYTFYDNEIPETRKNPKYKAHELGNGCMLYMTRKCIDTIGGFDTDFGLGKFEHPEYSRRAYNAKLVPHPFIDVRESKDLFHAMDDPEKNKFESVKSMSQVEELMLASQNSNKFYKKIKDSHYKDFM